MDEPSRRQDRTALLVLGGAAALVVALGAYLFLSIRSQPDTPPDAKPGESLAQRARDAVQKQIAELKQESKPKPAPAAPSPPPPQPPKAQAPQKPQAEGAGKAERAAPIQYAIPPGRIWRYNVKLEPDVWKDVTLTYRTVPEGSVVNVRTEFRHSGGQSAFNLGTFARGHPSHSNTRFPGFFMYAAYLDQPLRAGQKVAFAWPWQGKPAGSEKRFEGSVTRFEDVKVASGSYLAARVEGTLSYVEGGQVRARAQEVFWYTPQVAQVIKIERQGAVPDEAVRRIVAELAEHR